MVDEPDLKVPHPELTQRSFVLVPLVELDPLLAHPVSGETLLSQLYDAAAVDPAAREFVERQTRDRYATLLQWVDSSKVSVLGLLTSFETYRELRRRAGLSQRQVVAHLQKMADELL